MKLRVCFVLALGLLLPHFASADILPPGHRGIKHTIEFKGAKKFPKLRFVLYPTHPWAASSMTLGGEGPFWFRGQPQMYALTPAQLKQLKALQKARVITEAVRKRVRAFMKQRPRSALKLSQIRVVKVSSPLYVLKTVYEIRGVKGKVVDLVKASEQAFDKAGKQIANPFAKKEKKGKKGKKSKRTSWLQRVPYKGPVFAFGWGLLLFVGFRRRKL